MGVLIAPLHSSQRPSKITAEAIAADESLPSNFDPRQFPILAAHWFGVRQSAKPSAEVVDLDLVRLAAALHRLGEAVGADVGSRWDMLERLAPRGHEAGR